MDTQKYIREWITDSIAIKQKLLDSQLSKIMDAADEIIARYRLGAKLIVFGNGGSAADAQHIATELVHQFEVKNRRCIPAIALTTNTSLLTAVGNDWGFDQVFERQVEGFATDKDVVLGISTSGNSANVLKGLEQAKKNGAFTIALSGRDGGKMAKVADISIIVPGDNTARIQESHIMVGHILCGLIETQLFD